MMSVPDQLKELVALHQSGMLTDEEFEAAKRKVVSGEKNAATDRPASPVGSEEQSDGARSIQQSTNLMLQILLGGVALAAIGFAGVVPYDVRGGDCSPPIVEIFRPQALNPNYNPDPRDMFNKNKKLPDVCEKEARKRLVITTPTAFTAIGGVVVMRARKRKV